MAFCAHCGGKLDQGTRFCASCGHAVSADPASPAVSGTGTTPGAAVAAAPAPATAGGGGKATKIIFTVLGVFTFLVLTAFAGCFYVGYRIKQRANEMGFNAKPYQGRRDPCRLVTNDEVAAAFHTPVVTAEKSGNVCTYDLGGTHAVAVDVTWEGGTLAMKLAHGAMKNMVAGMETFTPVAGVGDETYVEPMGSGVMLRKGDVMVNIDLRTAGQNADAGKQIAALIAGRL
jgi:hypothetical protein